MNFFFRCFLVIFFSSLTCMTAQAEELSHLWSQSFGDSASQHSHTVAVDGSGNVLITGGFVGTVDFGGGPLTSAGSYDIFLAKFNPSGNHLWSQSFGDSTLQWGLSVAVDDAGNIFLTGHFDGTVDFGGEPLTSAGFTDIFLAKFDPGGSHLWSQRFGDWSFQVGVSIAVDGSGNLLLTGTFGSTVDFGGGPLTSAGESDIFLVKFDTSGNHLWSQSFGDPEFQNGVSVAVDGSESVLLTGYFYGTVDFGGDPLTTAGDYDIYLAKFDPSGSHLWSQSFGDPAWQFGVSVAVDGSESVLLAGYFGGTVDFGGGPLTSPGDWDWDIFLAKFGPSGSHLWSQSFGSGSEQRGSSVAVDAVGDVLLTGHFGNTVDFGGGQLTCEGFYDVYLAKFDPHGHHLFSQRFEDSGAQYGKGVVVDGSEAVLLTGDFSGSVDFGGGPLTSAGIDIFLAKFESDEPTRVLHSQISAREVNFAVELSWIVLPDIWITQFEIFRAIGPDAGSSRKLATLHVGLQEQTYRDETVVPGETYYYWIGVVNIAGGRERFGPFRITYVGFEDPRPLSSYPNPVLDQTMISYYVPKPGEVILGIYDPVGRLIRTLVQGPCPAGPQAVLWDGANQAGAPVAGGVYFYQLKLIAETQTRRMILVR